MKATRTLTRGILVGMTLGVVVGHLRHRMAADAIAAKAIAGNFTVVAEIFLRIIKMIIAPLVFATLVSGIASMDDAKSIDRVGAKALAWFLAASLISAGIGLFFVSSSAKHGDHTLV